jgi:Protein of unknown function (DUF2905)
MPELARIFIFLGVLLILVGAVIAGLSYLHLPLGRLPGDLNWRGRNWSVSFPLATCVLVSVVLSLILWVIGRIRH